ncbi:MAG: S9 family peptidase, partial [Bryobacteraceae bacterium]
LYDVAAKSDTELLSLAPLEDAAKPALGPERFAWENRRVREQELQWSSSGRDLLILARGDLFLWHAGSGKWDQLTATPQSERDPKLSPDARRVAFRRDHDLYALDIASHRETRLTSNGSPTLLNGETDWVYPEELELGTAFWWSPDSQSIAYLQFDTSREPLFPHSDLLGPRPVYEPQRYPRAGDPNPDVRLGVVSAAGGPTRWLDVGETRDTNLIARVHWMPDSRRLAVERLNRIQNRLELLSVDTASFATQTILSESDPYWVNLQDDLRFLKNGKEFLWSSERDGFRHLYLYTLDGKESRRLTKGSWEVTEVAGIDESQNVVYFVSSEPSPLERQLYSVKLNGKGKRRISTEPGTHGISMGPGCRYYLDTFSSAHEPTRETVYSSDGVRTAVYREADRRPLEDYDLPSSEFLHVRASDGTLLYARLLKPTGFQPGRKYPAIVSVYGGPQAQMVRDEWAGIGENEYWASRGFVVWELDNRGSSGRGHAFESVVFRDLGPHELSDQEDGVRYLISLGFVDPARIGVSGWSYGGFMTLNCLLNAPDMFRAGIAGAPVTDWRNYDTIYTERYMGLPQDNPAAYREAALPPKALNLKAQLLILHNIEDDNVLFQNTMQMVNALEQAGKPFEMVLYPQKNHGVSGTLRRHLLKTMTAFFERTLKSAKGAARTTDRSEEQLAPRSVLRVFLRS